MKSIAWEFNFLGEPGLTHQALTQVEGRKVEVEDGWMYFVHRWIRVVAELLHFDLTPALFEKLNGAASSLRAK